MGNCLALQDKVIKIMKMDGKVLEYKAPLKVQQVLSEFAGHSISDSLPVYRHLHPDNQLLCGHMYYLLPSPLLPFEVKKRKQFNPVMKTEGGAGVVRIKLVMTKQELVKMLTEGGVVSAVKMVSHLQNRERKGVDVCDRDDSGSSKGWRPALESIPEGS